MSYKHSENYIASPPGVILQDILKDHEITYEEAASMIGVPDEFFYDLIEGDASLTSDIAERLEMAFGVPTSFWINFESLYQRDLKKVKKENAALVLEPA